MLFAWIRFAKFQLWYSFMGKLDPAKMCKLSSPKALLFMCRHINTLTSSRRCPPKYWKYLRFLLDCIYAWSLCHVMLSKWTISSIVHNINWKTPILMDCACLKFMSREAKQVNTVQWTLLYTTYQAWRHQFLWTAHAWSF